PRGSSAHLAYPSARPRRRSSSAPACRSWQAARRRRRARSGSAFPRRGLRSDELLEVGLAAFVERFDAFLRFVRLVVVLDGLDAEEADAADVFGVGVERALGDRQRGRAHLVDLLAPLVDFGVELVVRHDLVDEAHLLGLGGAVLAAQEPDLARLLLANDARQVGRAPARIDRADLRADLAEGRLLGGD